MTTEVVAAGPPVTGDQSAGSALFLDSFGRLFVSGIRSSGDGAGSASTPATANPTLVTFPPDTTIVDAAGSTNNFSVSYTTSYMALDSEGGVWTWGAPYGGVTLLGRGGITTQQSYSPGLVTSTLDGGSLPTIIDIERTENQFLALDSDGTLWSWGYAGENLPRTGVGTLPGSSNETAAEISEDENCGTGPTVTWHTIWGGNNASGAVATNGLIYNWGYDTALDNSNTQRQTQLCPALMESANRALFSAYPEYYHTADGLTYDESALTATQLTARYEQIVADMENETLDVCADAYAKEIVDESSCPVRQLSFSARAPRLLLQNGDLYTWTITSSYGQPFLGRTGDEHTPAIALTGVDYVVPGVSSVTALLLDGSVLGWGSNSYCQAIGTRPSGTTSCATEVEGQVVTLPTPISGLEGVEISALGATQCATWAQASDGRMWAWGGGTITGSSYTTCSLNAAATRGYKIYDTTQATNAAPYGVPITTASTSTIRVR